MISTDLHVHTSHSVDCSTDMADQCKRALAAGLERVAFTDHKDFIPELEGVDYFCIDDFFTRIHACRTAFPDLSILAGVEVDFSSAYAQQAVDFVERNDFDLVIGSVHYLGTDPISETRSASFFESTPAEEVMPVYFSEVRACAETGVFDTIGHLDMIKRHSMPFYGRFDPNDHADMIQEILRTLIGTNTCLEINTSGLRHDPQEIYPHEDIIALYSDLGGEHVTVGSDAHITPHLGFEFDTAEKMISKYQLTPHLG